MSCLIVREDDKIVKVLAPNDKPSLLYEDILKYVNEKGSQKLINQIPYLQAVLAEGAIKGTTPEEVAVGIWSIAYTEAFSDMVGRTSKIFPILDKNGEIKFENFKDVVINPKSLYRDPADSYVLDPERAKTVSNATKKGNQLQRKIADALVVSPDNPVWLEPVEHVYYDAAGNKYSSVTTGIKGVLVDPNNEYEINRQYGNAFDRILTAIIDGQKFEDIESDEKVKFIPGPIAKQAYNTLSAYISGITEDGSIIIPQVMLGDPEVKVAGSLDVLIIKPDGTIKIVDLKVSKNSIHDMNYSRKAYPTHEGSKIGGEMTTKMQHGIQVAVYKRLVEQQGLEVSGVETVHIKLKLGENKALEDFVWEGTQVHSPMANRQNAMKVVPTLSPAPHRLEAFRAELELDNPVAAADFLSIEESLPEVEEEGDFFDKVVGKVKKVLVTLETRRDYFEKIKDNHSFRPKKETVHAINKLIVLMGDELRNGKPSRAYGKFMNHAKEELTNLIKYAIDPKSKSSARYAGVLLEGDKFIESYRGLADARLFGSPDQRGLFSEVVDLLDEAKSVIDQGLSDHVQNLYKSNSNKNLTEEELKSILSDVMDISTADYFAGDIATSTDPLLATIDKIVKNATQTAKDRTDTAISLIKTAGAKLLKASGVTKPGTDFYDFMKLFTKDGKFTGRYIQPIGQQYWDLYYSFRNRIKEKSGENKQYIHLSDLTTADPKDVEYNKQLYIDKTANRQFLNAEVSTPTGFEDGEYHRYTQEFKEIRAKYVIPESYTNKNGLLSWSWQKRPEISEQEYDLFIAKYYNKAEYWGPVFEADGQFHGQVTLRKGTFVKPEYSEVREHSAKGMDMRDPKYVKLMEPSNALETAQGEFFKTWISEMEQTLDKLDPSVARQMRGKVARVRGHFMDTMKKNGEGFLNVVGRNLRNAFRADVYTDQRVIDEAGNISTGIPVTFVGKLQNQGALSYLKKTIADLESAFIAKTVSRKDYLKEKKRLSESLRIEEGKVSANEIESDMVDNLIAFRTMAENFEAMSEIESDLLSIKKIVENRSYVMQDSVGRKLVQKGSKDINNPEGNILTSKGAESLTALRLKKYMKMVFYNDESFNRSTMAMIAQRLQNITSLKGIGFNIFGAVNNYVYGRISNSIEGWSGQHFESAALSRATMVFTKEHLPGWFAKLGTFKKHKYDEVKAFSKYEAMVDHFRMVRKPDVDSGRVDAISWAYVMQEGGEYNVQSKTGMAVAMSTQLTNTQTGETESLYDAYDFDPNTGQIKLKPGYEFSDADRHKITNKIYEVNKQIHGNYAFQDRMVLQEHWLGQLAAQFHKWIYPSFKARFKDRYYDQNLGELEGRYLTVWNLIGYMRETEGNFYQKMVGGWQNMDKIQIGNMRKNAAESVFLMTSVAMFHVLSALGSGVDDDDENLKKFANFLTYQSTRTTKEILTFVPVAGLIEQWQLVKNPVAAIGTAKDFGDVMFSSLRMPFPPYEKNFYERGVHKGDLKAWKELKDVTPALNILNKWDAFEQVKSFYIK